MEKNKLIEEYEERGRFTSLLCNQDFQDYQIGEFWRYLEEEGASTSFFGITMAKRDLRWYALSTQPLKSLSLCERFLSEEKDKDKIEEFHLCNPRSVLWDKEKWMSVMKEIGYNVIEDEKSGNLVFEYYHSVCLPVSLYSSGFGSLVISHSLPYLLSVIRERRSCIYNGSTDPVFWKSRTIVNRVKTIRLDDEVLKNLRKGIRPPQLLVNLETDCGIMETEVVKLWREIMDY